MSRRAISVLGLFMLLGGLLAHAGQFMDAPTFPTGTGPVAVAVGDFTGAGVQKDVAVVNSASGTISIFIGGGNNTFQAPTSYTVGTSPAGIVAADFNGDGKIDLAVTSTISGHGTVSVFLGNGDGTFQLPTATSNNYTVGNGPHGLVASDFNGDGIIDLAVVNTTDSTYQLILGNGGNTATFNTPQAAISTRVTAPIAIAAGHFATQNTSTSPKDLVIVCNNSTANQIVVLTNNGSGTFSLSAPTISGTASSVAVADFNGDQYDDIAVATNLDSGSVEVLLNSGTGAFPTFAPYFTGASPTGVAAVDFNHDGYVDLALTSGLDNSVSVLLNAGASAPGTFNTQANYGTGAIPEALAIGNFNSDTNNDIVVANFGSNNISSLLGNGDGTFQTLVDYFSGRNSNSVIVGDFNNDGIPDLAFADGNCSGCSANTVSVILGNGDGTFKGVNAYTTTSTTLGDVDTYSLAAGDFNQDGNLDIVAVNNQKANVAILLGNGTGSGSAGFSSPTFINVGQDPVAVVVGDFNGDGSPDIAVVNSPPSGAGSVTILLNATAPGSGTVVFNQAPGSPYTVGNGPISIAAGYLAGTSNGLDLVVVNKTDGTVSVLINNNDGTGGFNKTAVATYPTYCSSPTSCSVSQLPSGVAIASFTNGAGNLNLFVANHANGTIGVLVGNGDGTFQQVGTPAVSTIVGGAAANYPWSLVAGDFNGDGKTDIAMTSSATTGAGNLVTLIYGNGDGTFNTATGTIYPSGPQAATEAQSIAAADFLGVGVLDLAVANASSSTASILLNSGGTLLNLVPSANNTTYGAPVTFTATLNPAVEGSATPTGTVTFYNGSTALGQPVALSNTSGNTAQASLTTPSLPVGSNKISAVYSGDSNYQSHVGQQITQNVGQASTTTVLSPTSPINFGQSVTFTATVCPAAGCPPTASAPSGSVTFSDGGSPLGMGTLSNGVASYTAASLAAGTHSITASYAGDTNFTGSSATGSQVVVGPSFSLSASAFSPASVAPGQSSTSTVTITTTGGFNMSSIGFTCTVNGPAGATGPAPTCTVGSISGGTVTVTVGTTAPSPSFRQRASSSMLPAMALLFPAAVIGTIVLPRRKGQKLMVFALILLLSAGVAVQSACGGGGSSSTTPPPSSNKSASNTALASSNATALVGQPVTFTANVTSSASGTPTGTVTFMNGSTTLGTGTVASGSATYTTSSLAAGTYQITANYGGDSSFNASTSSAVTQTVDNPGTASGSYSVTVTGTATGAATQTANANLTVN